MSSEVGGNMLKMLPSFVVKLATSREENEWLIFLKFFITITSRHGLQEMRENFSPFTHEEKKANKKKYTKIQQLPFMW